MSQYKSKYGIVGLELGDEIAQRMSDDQRLFRKTAQVVADAILARREEQGRQRLPSGRRRQRGSAWRRIGRKG
jgi:hypothetical protein